MWRDDWWEERQRVIDEGQALLLVQHAQRAELNGSEVQTLRGELQVTHAHLDPDLNRSPGPLRPPSHSPPPLILTLTLTHNSASEMSERRRSALGRHSGQQRRRG